MRVVKSLIFERQRLRVDKRVIKPGHNAINVYHVVTPQHQEVTPAEEGASLTTGKMGTKREKPDRLNNKGDRLCHPHSQTTHNIPLRPAPAIEKTGSKYLTADSKPRYLTQELTPEPEKIAVFLAIPVKTTSPKALQGL
jgi:hypothetical protein